MPDVPPLPELFARHIDQIADDVTQAVIDQAGGAYAGLAFGDLQPRVLAGMRAFQASLEQRSPQPFAAFFSRASAQRSTEGYDVEEMENAIVATGDVIMPFVARHYAAAPPATLIENVHLAASIHLGGMQQILTTFARVHDEIVARHSRELARRAEQLDLINRVGRNATSLLDLQTLLPHSAMLIRAAFGYYAVLILLVDTQTGDVRLSAAATAEDVDLMARGLRTPLGARGMVAHVAASGEPLVVGDVSAEPRYLRIDALPRTRSELTLPLRSGDQVLGVLDLESEALDAFQPEDVRVLQTLADQLAIAIYNARLYEATRQANLMKSRFLASMSHELRTPLNAIINFTAFVTRGVFGPVTAEQRSYLDRVVAQGKHLLSIINDVLDLSKIEAGQMALQCEAVALPAACREAFDSLAALAREKQLTLDVDLPADLPAIWADPIRLRQVLLNLLSNAIKFTPPGGHILARATQVASPVPHLLVSVADSGIGIPADQLTAIFQEFHQTEAGRREGGTGLGLAISSRIVAMFGGRMWAESPPGQGATIYFTLPLAPARPTGDAP
jgi:signal transduction histidine kinase